MKGVKSMFGMVVLMILVARLRDEKQCYLKLIHHATQRRSLRYSTLDYMKSEISIFLLLSVEINR